MEKQPETHTLILPTTKIIALSWEWENGAKLWVGRCRHYIEYIDVYRSPRLIPDKILFDLVRNCSYRYKGNVTKKNNWFRNKIMNLLRYLLYRYERPHCNSTNFYQPNLQLLIDLQKGTKRLISQSNLIFLYY